MQVLQAYCTALETAPARVLINHTKSMPIPLCCLLKRANRKLTYNDVTKGWYPNVSQRKKQTLYYSDALAYLSA